MSWLGNPWVGIAGLAVFTSVAVALYLTRNKRD